MVNQKPCSGTGSLQRMMRAISQLIIRAGTPMAGNTNLTKSVRRGRDLPGISLENCLSHHQVLIGAGLKNALTSYAKMAGSLSPLVGDHAIKGIWMNRKGKLFSPSGQISLR